jgi:Domain of unknown function (DUF4375)
MCDGFDGYFFNCDDDPGLALQALEEIGAVQTAAIVRRAFARFPGGRPPANRFDRQNVLAILNPEDAEDDVFEPDDHDLFAYPEDVEALAAAFRSRQDST